VESGAGEEGAGAEPAWGDLDIEERQAEVAARRLKELLESGVGVWDSRLGAERLVTWRDMVVLHPAPGPVSERWARSFARVGVPLEARRGGFFRALEVADLVNVARMLDNPLQDHPVLAVLRSPMVGLGVDELAAIRLMDRRGRFWEAVERCAAGDPLPGEWAEVPEVRAALATARGRLRWFLEGFRRWRLLARQGSVTRCLEAVLVETAYEAWLRAQPRAEARLANVRRLLALTRQFDQAQRRGLYRFLRFVEAQAETGEEMESAQAAAGDSVRLMSMHQSKGLEFPVVVAAGLGRKFNLRDLREEWLLDEEYGLCPPVLAPGRVRGYPSLPRWLAGRRQLTEALGEQTRLFYVACTRAADRLLLLGAVRDATLAKWSGTSPRFTDRDLLRVGEPLGWLGPLMSELTGQSGWVESETGRGRWLDWRLHRGAPVPVPAGVGEESGGESEAAGAGVAGEEIGAEVVEAIRGRLEWRYEREAATQLPAKTAVTALRRQWALDEEAVVADPDLVNRPAVRSDEASAPVSRDAVTRGLVHHLFFEQLDLAGPLDLPDLEQQRERLVLAGWLGREAAALIDLEGVAAFWSTEAGSVLRQERSAVQRELPFTARLSRREALLLGAPGTMAGWSEEDFQVIQGVADLVLFRPGELWIVDYKTDRVEGAAIAERTAKYEAQLRLYAHALSGVYRVPVTRRLLWFIHPRQLVEVT
jgi:ATP-dependent helicase/nuclease subunit A